MFRAVPPPIIRSTQLHTSFRYCQPILLLAGTVAEMESQFHVSHGTSQQQYWLTIPEGECAFMCS